MSHNAKTFLRVKTQETHISSHRLTSRWGIKAWTWRSLGRPGLVVNTGAGDEAHRCDVSSRDLDYKLSLFEPMSSVNVAHEYPGFKKGFYEIFGLDFCTSSYVLVEISPPVGSYRRNVVVGPSSEVIRLSNV